MNLFLSGFIFIIIGIISAIILNEKLKMQVFSFFVTLGAICFLIPSFKVLISGHPLSYSIRIQPPIYYADIFIDGLSAIFVIIISAISIITSFYSIGYLKDYCGKNKQLSSHLFFFGILIMSMILVTVSSNYFMFLLVWELMSLSSFFLVIFENDKEDTVNAGINYLITMHISLIFLIIGFLMLSHFSGSQNFSDFSAIFKNTLMKNKAIIIFIFLFTGFGIKCGIFPFHSWLPKAHPAAPSHISAIMSGVMIKTGIYGILRIISFMDIPSKILSVSILTIALLTALISVLYALTQTDIKKLLAYSSVENIGIILIGIGFGMLGLSYQNKLISAIGFTGAIMHLINHSVFKTLLFFGAGTIYKKLHCKNMEILGGLAKYMPYTAILFFVGCLGISGIPGFSGFAGEFVIYLSMLKSVGLNTKFGLIISVLSIAGLALIGGVCLFCFAKLFSIVFLGTPRNKKIEEELIKENTSDPSFSMLASMFILSVMVVLTGLFPQYLVKIISNPVNLLIKQSDFEIVSNFNYLNYMTSLVSYSTILFIVMVIMTWLIRYILLKNKKVEYFKTWDCGYQFGNNKMQYTGSSFIRPFWNIIKLFVKVDYYRTSPEGLYPKHLDFKIVIIDFAEGYFIKPMCEVIRKVLNLFSWMQSGNTQAYILYGIIFIIIILISIMIN